MKFKPPAPSSRTADRAGFTLAEVLAALLFMAIVIPVTVAAVRVASQAGQVGERKATAARIAERVLNEMTAGSQTVQSSGSGTIEEGPHSYRWSMASQPWGADANAATLNLVVVGVTFAVQGQDYETQISTLIDTSSQLTGTIQ